MTAETTPTWEEPTRFEALHAAFSASDQKIAALETQLRAAVEAKRVLEEAVAQRVEWAIPRWSSLTRAETLGWAISIRDLLAATPAAPEKGEEAARRNALKRRVQGTRLRSAALTDADKGG